MAKATAKCTCATCGAIFTKSVDKHNRAEAAAWEKWAVGHYDECPKCWGARKREEEKKAGLKADVTIDTRNKKIFFILNGDTYPIKEQIKAIKGAYFTDMYPASHNIIENVIGFKAPPKRWVVIANNPAELDAAAESVEAIGFEVMWPCQEELVMAAAWLNPKNNLMHDENED